MSESEMGLSREEIAARLAECGCDDVAPYAALFAPSVWLEPDPTPPSDLMKSRFGGPAMMPEGFTWPTYTAEPYMGRDPNEDPKSFTLWYAKQQKLPMWLIAQINLAEIPIDTPLPREGLLSFFTDPFDGVWGNEASDRQGFEIMYVPREQFGAVRPYHRPENVNHDGAFGDWEWPVLGMEFVVKWSISDYDAVSRLLDKESDSGVAEQIQEAMDEIRGGYQFGHFLLDAGMNHQSDPRESAVAVFDPSEPAAEDDYRAFYQQRRQRAIAEWTCLLSLTKDDHLRPVVSDTGGLSFLIRKADLAAKRFDRPWFIRS